MVLYEMGKYGKFFACKAILYHQDPVAIAELEIKAAATLSTAAVANDTEGSDISAFRVGTAKRMIRQRDISSISHSDHPSENITLSYDSRHWHFKVQASIFNIPEWRLLTGLIKAARQALTLEKNRFQNFVYDDDRRNVDLLMHATPKDATKRALTKSTVLKTVIEVMEHEYQLVKTLHEFYVLTFRIDYASNTIVTGEFSLHEE